MPLPLLAALPFAVKAALGVGAALGIGKAGSSSIKAIKKGKAKKTVRQVIKKGGKPTQEQLNLAKGLTAEGYKKGGFFDSEPGRAEALSTKTPDQLKFQNASLDSLNNSLPYYQLPGQQLTPQQQQQQFQQHQQGFQPFEDQARKGFYQSTIPSLAERFTSLGSGNSLRSPVFQNTLARAGSNFESDLNAQRAQYGLNQQNMQNSNFHNLMSGGLSQSRENIYHPGKNAGLVDVAAGIIPFAGQYAGTYYGEKHALEAANRAKTPKPKV